MEKNDSGCVACLFRCQILFTELENLLWFIEHGEKKNRFRKNFNRALDIATTIVEFSNNEKLNLSGFRRKTI